MWDKIQRFLAAPVFEESEDKTRAAALLNPLILSMFGVVLLSAVATIFVFAEKLGSGIAVGLIFVIILAAKTLMHRGRVRLSAVFFLVGVWLPSNAVFLLSGQESLIGAANVSVVVISGLILGESAAIAVAVLSSLVALTTVVLDALGAPLPVLFPSPPSSSWVMLTVSLVMAAIPLNMALRRLRESLERSQRYADDLEAQRKEMQDLAEARNLELERRATYLGATTAIASEAAAMGQDPQQLLERLVTTISDQFGFYHTGLFLLNSSGEWAELHAASSAGGKQMLARGHRLRVGPVGIGQGIVGNVASRGRYRIALDVGEDAVFFDNPDLPKTRSEIALPLRVRDEIIGVLDVQSVEADAFSSEDVSVLQALADQVAISINNARLFRQVQESFESERKAYGDLTRSAWRELLHKGLDRAFVSGERGGVPSATWEPHMKKAAYTGEITADPQGSRLAIPISVRGQVIGVVEGRKPGDGETWTATEMDLLETLTDRLSVALESARLYEDTQRRAARERAIREITDEMERATDIESLMRITAESLIQTLGGARAAVRLGALEDAVGDAQETSLDEE